MKPIQPARPGFPLRASDINASTNEIVRQSRATYEGATIDSSGTGLSINVDRPEGFWAAINGRLGFRYGWKAVERETTTGKWDGYYSKERTESLPTENFAIEANNSLGVSNGTVVWLTPIKSIEVDGVQRTIYQFVLSESYGASLTEQSVVVDVGCDNKGINLVKNTFAAYNFNVAYGPTFLSLTDVIPKTFAGAANCVLTVNAAGTGIEFGAAVAQSSGTGQIQSQISTMQSQISSLQNQITSLTNTINTLANTVNALAVRVSALENQ